MSSKVSFICIPDRTVSQIGKQEILKDKKILSFLKLTNDRISLEEMPNYSTYVDRCFLLQENSIVFTKIIQGENGAKSSFREFRLSFVL